MMTGQLLLKYDNLIWFIMQNLCISDDFQIRNMILDQGHDTF